MSARSGSTRARPMAWARAAVALATTVLPAGPVRARWRQEFLADLSVLGRRQQASYAAGVLVHAWALRSALHEREALSAEKATTVRPPLRCRLNVHHRWRVVSTEDGNPHWECTACHKLWKTVRPPGDWSPGF